MAPVVYSTWSSSALRVIALESLNNWSFKWFPDFSGFGRRGLGALPPF
jgi:hypothetical protein